VIRWRHLSSGPRTNKRRLAHPLCGADLGTLASLSLRAGGIDRGGALRLGLAWLAALARLPVVLAESLTVGRGASRATPARPPVFIIGHWRSGTTHLYNVMSKSPAFSYVSPLATGLPWDFVLLGRLFGRFLEKSLPEDRFIDSIPVRPDSPQEDEIAIAAMQTLSFYHGLYFPRRFDEELDRGVFLDGARDAEIRRWERAVRRFFVKIERENPDRTLLIKNPVYTARVADLSALFPGCRFIHIHRDPRRVFPSMRNFYHKLFPQLGLGPAAHVDVDEAILRTYDRMMERLDRDAAALPPGRLTHVRFEVFEDDPIETIRRIHEDLDLDGFDAGLAPMRAYLGTVRSYKKNLYTEDPEIESLLAARWGRWIDRLGYAEPAAAC
jgi:hypothetical protein